MFYQKNKMRQCLFTLTIILVTNSCISSGNLFTDEKINKQNLSESQELKITTTIEKYSKSKEWFYGTIEIENKTDKNIYFNFNQNLKIGNKIFKADYNIKPISYAASAFKIPPNSESSWEVVWRMKNYRTEMEITILEDLTMKEFKD